jgi:hypothetical protein
MERLVTLMRRRKYTNVDLKKSLENDYDIKFESCGEAAGWLADVRISKNKKAARVGISTVLTGKRASYRGFTVEADRLY